MHQETQSFLLSVMTLSNRHRQQGQRRRQRQGEKSSVLLRNSKRPCSIVPEDHLNHKREILSGKHQDDENLGILAVCPPGQYCHPGLRYCVAEEDSNNYFQTDGDQNLSPTGRKIQQGQYALSYFDQYCVNCDVDFCCDCSDYNQATGTGSIKCIYEYYCRENICYEVSATMSISGGELIGDQFCYSFLQPIQTTVCDNTYCPVTIDNVECAYCSESSPSSGCFNIDCRNAGGYAVTSCDSASWFDVITRLILNGCNMCGDGNTLDFPDSILAGYSATCSDVYAYVFENIADGSSYCAYAQQYFAPICCEGATACNICGDGPLLYPEGNVNIPGSGYITCDSLFDSGIFGLIDAGDCSLITSTAGPICCTDPPCIVCPNDGPVTNPDNIVQFPGQPEVTCGQLQEIGRQGMAFYYCVYAELVVPMICGCGTVTALPSGPPVEIPTTPPTASPTAPPADLPTHTPTANPSKLPTQSSSDSLSTALSSTPQDSGTSYGLLYGLIAGGIIILLILLIIGWSMWHKSQTRKENKEEVTENKHGIGVIVAESSKLPEENPPSLKTNHDAGESMVIMPVIFVATGTKEYPETKVGISLARAEGSDRIYISKISETSIFANQGLRYGMTIRTINDVPITTLQQASAILSKHQGTMTIEAEAESRAQSYLVADL